MAKFFDHLDDRLTGFIREQPIFFVASAPGEGGRVNCSPKDGKSLRVLGPNTVAYLDLTGSGAETAAHVRENGRLTLMFCGFGKTPLILRLYGRGRIVQPGDVDWEALHAHFDPRPGERAIVVLDIDSAQTSCGFGVPFFDYRGERPTLDQWAERKEATRGLADYRREKNAESIDGIPTGLVEDS